ncbi:MAG: transcription antitermination factor NusB [Clostridia bacterium]
MSYLKNSLDALSDIIRKGAFINIRLNDLDEKERALVTKIVYGVVENYFELKYIAESLTARPPKPIVQLIIMQAAYCLKYLSIPAYAVVNESVNLTADAGVKQLKGFVNAVLNKIAREEYKLPERSSPRYEEVKYNLPMWLIDEVKKEYPQTYHTILSAKGREDEHIRLSKNFSQAKFLQGLDGEFERTSTGFYVKNTDYIKRLFKKGALTYQGYTSTLAVEAMGDIKGKKLIDLCAAPGGKSVLAAEKGADVLALDLYPHRQELIKAYASRMKVELDTGVGDGTVFNKKWENGFDIALVDAPCSGLGVLSKRRDIIFKRSKEDIARLAALQLRILENAARYVKNGGLLIYSTCTILHRENRGNVDIFLANHPEFKLEKLPLVGGESGDLQFLPNDKGADGFYICRMRKGNNL